ncbi:MAG: hypothetical protein AMXMBFR56_71480 [Polyangiaceae bacterium]
MRRPSDLLEPNNLRLVFGATDWARDLLSAVRADAGFVARAARALSPLALPEPAPPAGSVFGPLDPFDVPKLRGKRIAVVASGGSGATAALCGVRRAFEEAGLEAAALSACSGSMLFASLWAAGLDAEAMAKFWLELGTRDYLDPKWRDVLRAPLRRFRGFGGLLHGEALEQTYLRRFGAMKLRETRVPLSVVLWNVDTNELRYVGTKATPDLVLARAVRAAISIPIFVEPVRMGAHEFGDGGVVDIFPTRPLADEEPLDLVVGINSYMPPDFAGEDVSGWMDETWSILRASSQLRWSVYLELAREHARALGDRLVLLHPVPYAEVRGARFYDTFLDRREWPRYMRLGHAAAREALLRIGAA